MKSSRKTAKHPDSGDLDLALHTHLRGAILELWVEIAGSDNSRTARYSLLVAISGLIGGNRISNHPRSTPL